MSSATVALAAEAYGVEPARIAKTLSLRIGERVVLIVAAGTSRMDNKKVKALFGGKPKMLGLEEVAEITGHEVGGVCPFGLKTPLPVYCDVSLKAFDIVVPAAGSTHSAVKITPARMAELTGAEWVDVCELRPAPEARPIRLPHNRASVRNTAAAAWLAAAASVAARGHASGSVAAALRRDAIGLLLLGARFEHRAATVGELRRVLPQASHDPADIRDLTRRRDARHRACRPSAVPRFRDTPATMRARSLLLRRSRWQGRGQSAAFACPGPFVRFSRLTRKTPRGDMHKPVKGMRPRDVGANKKM